MRVFVVGGTGFVGRPVVEALAQAGHKVVALVRDPRQLAGVDGVETVAGELQKPHTYRGRALGCQASIHMVGLLRGSRKKFHRVVAKGTQAWAKECQEAGVKHLVFVSAVGVGPHGTPYQRTKWTAEQAIRNSGVPFTILRPSFVIGPGGFVAEIRRFLRLRVHPVFGKQTYHATPVARADLVQALVRSLTTPAAKSRVFHVGGPDELAYIEIVKTIRDESGIRAAVPRFPKWTGFTIAALAGWLPFMPATRDNLRMLFAGNVAPEDEWEAVFGIRARPFQASVRDAVAGLRSKKV